MAIRALVLATLLGATLLACPPPAPEPVDAGPDSADAGVTSALERPPGAVERPPTRLPDELRPPK